jgi:hypothetical protein
MKKRVGVAIASCLIAMAIIALLYFTRSREADPSSRSRGDMPVEELSEPRIAAPLSTEDLSVQRVGTEQAAISVRLSDPIIGSALRLAQLWSISNDTGTHGAPLVETNHEGIAHVTESALAELRGTLGAPRRARVTFEARNPFVECRVVHVGNEQEGRPIDVEVVAHSGLRVFLSRESGNLREANLWAYALPAIPDSIVDSNQRITLETLRASDPQRYRHALETLAGELPEPLTLFRSVVDSSAAVLELHLPYEGDVLLSAGDIQASGVSQVVKITLGGTVDTHIRLIEKPTISGRVLMDTGVPVVGVRVTVCVKTVSDPGEDFPRTAEEDGSPGMIIITGEHPSYPAATLDDLRRRRILPTRDAVLGYGGGLGL